MSVKVGKSGTGAAHADYISREGKYARKEKDDLEQVVSGNLPSWAAHPSDFWKAADEHERANGSVYREFELALPRELTKVQRLTLVQEFVEQEIGDRHTYTFAIHNPKAAIDGGEQPHAHIMFSERTIDGVQRSAEQYFKRYNAKQPERGGCQKASTAKTPTERKADLVQRRERWAEIQNKHLTQYGHADQVTHLSLEARGIEREVEPHLGPKLAQMVAKSIRENRAVVNRTPDPTQTKQGEESPLDLYRRTETTIRDLMKQARERFDQVDRQYWIDKRKAEELYEQCQRIVAERTAMPEQPKLFGRKEWDAQVAGIVGRYEKAKEAQQAAHDIFKKTEQIQAKLQTELNRDAQERRLLETVKTQKPEWLEKLAEGKRQAEAIKAQELAQKRHQAKPDHGRSR